MTPSRHFLIATGTARYSNMPQENRGELDAEVERMQSLFTRRGYALVPGFSMDMKSSDLRTAIRKFVSAEERTEDDVLVFYYTGHGQVDRGDFLFVPTNADENHPHNEGIPARELARWLFAGTKIRQVMIILDTCHAGHGANQVAIDALETLGQQTRNSAPGNAGVVVVTATRPKEQAESTAFTKAFEKAVHELEEAGLGQGYLEIAELVRRISKLTPQWQHAGCHVIGSEQPARFLLANQAAGQTIQDIVDGFKKAENELLTLLEAMRTDNGYAGPLSPNDQATLIHAIAGLPPPDDDKLSALYLQSLERATGQPPPKPLRKPRDYADVIHELAQYLPGPSSSVHPIVTCCALLTEWFPDLDCVAPLRSLVGRHTSGTINLADGGPRTDMSVIVLFEPGHPAGHFLLTVWCYYGPDDVDLAYRSLEAARLEQLREDLRQALADALNRMALRVYNISDSPAPAFVEFIVPVELLDEPIEDWPIGDDETGDERIGWHYPVVLRDLGRLRQPRLHARWRDKWQRLKLMSDPQGLPFTWFDCSANSDRAPVKQFFAANRDLLAFTGPPLNGHLRELLGTGLKAGVPAMLWRGENCVQDTSGCDCVQFIELVETSVAGASLRDLPAHVHVLRMTMSGNGPGRFHRLALLWDDPSRWAEPPARFADPTRRGVSP